MEERKNDYQEYIKGTFDPICKLEYYSSFSDIERKMYIPCSSIQTLENRKQEKLLEESNPINQNIDLRVGNLDAEQTKRLYSECNNVVFKYCTLEDFVNSLNKPDECNLEVKNKNLLFVLYTYFFNYFKHEGDSKIKSLNEKLEITEYYSKKNYNSDKPTKNQNEFDKTLREI